MLKQSLAARTRLLGAVFAIVCGATVVGGCFGGSFALAITQPPSAHGERVTCGPSEVRVNGYWEYRQGHYEWMMGRCIAPKAGCKYIPGHYKAVKRGKVRVRTWKAGRWNCKGPKTQVVVASAGGKAKVVITPKKKAKVVITPKKAKVVITPKKKKAKVVITPKKKKAKVVITPKKAKVVVTPKKSKVVIKPKAKPAPKVIVMKLPAPKAKPRKAKKGKVWMLGHYAWDNGKNTYKWVPGHWKKAKKGKTWRPGTYKVERRGQYQVKIWIPGRWR